MLSVERLITNYLQQGRVMQIATVADNRPWICTVYYVVDAQQRLYWLSLPSRRHSQEIKLDPHTAIAVAIKYDQPVIGIQAEGIVKVIDNPNTVAAAMEQYESKYSVGYDFYKHFIAGTNEHVLYCFSAARFGLFDESTFGDGVRREWVR